MVLRDHLGFVAVAFVSARKGASGDVNVRDRADLQVRLARLRSSLRHGDTVAARDRGYFAGTTPTSGVDLFGLGLLPLLV